MSSKNNKAGKRGIWVDLPTSDYVKIFHLQEMIHQKRQQEIIPDVVLLLEHSPCITLGRSGGYDNLLADNSVLQQHGITVHETSRGGNITYHGPGQLVCYPILSLAGEERDLHAYARKMEEVMIRTVSAFGIKASRRAGFPGVWTKEAKIGAIGVAVDKWVTMHGMSLNVCPDLNHFSFIVPCGIATNGVTSMEKLMGPSIDINRVRHEMRNQFCEIFQISMRSEELEYII
jgi:lipoate-protein ligase B